jgi:hypothetical protein
LAPPSLDFFFVAVLAMTISRFGCKPQASGFKLYSRKPEAGSLSAFLSLLGVSLLGGRDFAGRGAAFLAISFFGAGACEAGAKPSRLAASRANERDIRGVDRRFFTEPAALRMLLAAGDVLVNARDPFDQHAVALAIYLDHPALLAAIGASDHFDVVTCAN